MHEEDSRRLPALRRPMLPEWRRTSRAVGQVLDTVSGSPDSGRSLCERHPGWDRVGDLSESMEYHAECCQERRPEMTISCGDNRGENNGRTYVKSA